MITIIANAVKPNLARVVRSVVVNGSVWLLLSAVLCNVSPTAFAAEATPLKLQISADSEQLLPGEPIVVHVVVENPSGKDVALPSDPGRLLIWETAGDRRTFRQAAAGIGPRVKPGEARVLGAHEKLRWDEVVGTTDAQNAPAPLWPQPGRISLRAALKAPSKGTSNTVELRILKPTSDERAALELLGDVALIKRIVDQALTADDEKKIEAVYDQLERSNLRDRLAWVMGMSRLRRSQAATDEDSRGRLAVEAYNWLSAINTNPLFCTRAKVEQYRLAMSRDDVFEFSQLPVSQEPGRHGSDTRAPAEELGLTDELSKLGRAYAIRVARLQEERNAEYRRRAQGK